jgi:hypothetical protein
MVYLRLTFTDANGDAAGFGFTGTACGQRCFAAESHSFAAPSFGRVGPGQVDYPFNLQCGTASQWETTVSAWIYDESSQQSPAVVVHLLC